MTLRHLTVFLAGFLLLAAPARGQNAPDTSSIDLPAEGEFVLLQSDALLSGPVTMKTRAVGADSLIVADSLHFGRDRARALRVDSTTYRRGPEGDWVQLAQPGPIDLWVKSEFRMGGPTVSYGSDGQISHSYTFFQEVTVEYFSVDGGPIQEVKPDALRPVVRGVPESRRYVNRYQTLSRWQTGIGIAGVSLAVGGLAHGDRKELPVGVVIGIFASAVSQIALHYARKDKLKQAVKVYNQEKQATSEPAPNPNGDKYR